MTFFLALWLVTFVVFFALYLLIDFTIRFFQERRAQRRWNAEHEHLLRERRERVEAFEWPARGQR